MISSFTGAFVRAILIVLLIATPSMVIPGVSHDTTQIVALVAIFAAALTFFEYISTYPGLVEFRDAPPFNRVRYLSLFMTVLLLSVAVLGETSQSGFTLLVRTLGDALGAAIDVRYSPVQLIVLMLPEDMSAQHLVLVRTCAGIAYLISMLTLIAFVLIMRLVGWPNRTGKFNVWINLPTFDPTTGGDVVERLQRDSRFNIALGFLLPFLVPAAVKAASLAFTPVTLESPQTLIWTMAAWAFLPASLIMRGIAMGRIANMIAAQRRVKNAATEGELLPA